MRKILLVMVLFVQSFVVLSAQDVVCDTFHYATHNGEVLYLDRYMLDGEVDAPRPCMIFAFGGGFVKGVRNHEYYSIYFERLAREGIVVVSIDYRLGLKNLDADGGMVAMIGAFDNAVNMAVEDMYCATNFVIANSQEWAVDTTKIMLSGSSAGAITALQAEWLRCNGAKCAEVLPKDFRYAGIVSCAGAIFSTKGKPRFKSEPAPMLLFHGTSDSNVPYDHASVFGIGFYGSKYIVKNLEKRDGAYLFYSAEYVDHILAGTPLFEQCDLIMQFIRDYVLEGKRAQTTVEVESIGAERKPTRFTVKEYLETNYKR
jgi:predicted esterase